MYYQPITQSNMPIEERKLPKLPQVVIPAVEGLQDTQTKFRVKRSISRNMPTDIVNLKQSYSIDHLHKKIDLNITE